MKKVYKVVQQDEEYDCAAACVSMILQNYFSISSSIFELKPIIKNLEDGTEFSDLYRGLKRLGIYSKLCKGLLDERTFNEIEYPVITQIKTKNGYHYIVLFSKSKKKLIVGDPSNIRTEKITIKKFLKSWVPFFIAIDINKSNLKIKNSQTVKRITIIDLLKQVKFKFCFIVLASIFTYIIGIVLSGMFNLYFNLIIPQKLNILIPSLLTIYLFVSIVNQILKLLQSFVNNNVSKLFDSKILDKYLKGILNKPRYAIDSFDSAELLTDISNISTIREKILATCVVIPVDILWIAFSLFILLNISKKLSLMTVIMLLVLLYITILPNYYYEYLGRKFIDSLTKFNNYLIDHMTNLIEIRELKIYKSFFEISRKKYEELLSQRNKLINFDSIINNIRQIVSSSFTIILFSLGAIDIINNNLSTGSLLMFNSILGLTVNPLLEIANFQSLLVQGKVAMDRINMAMCNFIFTEKDYNRENLQNTRFKNIKIDKLYYSFDSSHKLFDNIGLNIYENSKVAFIGENGSGKTTIGKLICKQLLRDSGTIMFNNINIDNIPEKILDDKIIFVSTNENIINDTVFNNICLYRNIPKEHVIKMSKRIGLYQDLMSNGIDLNTKIGNKGTKLSFGQSQMIKILQTTLVSRDIYVFDEITNGLDRIHEKLVVDYLMNISGIKIFLTHDENLISKCNQIFEFENCKIKVLK